jgi:hypothetical protein
MFYKRYCFLVVLMASMVSSFAQAAEQKADFYIARDGNDRNPGTVHKPFATFVRAQQAVRELTKAGLKKDVLVLVRGGRYVIEKTLVFGTEDGGTEKHSVTYAAYGDERPLLSGGTRITGWRQEEEGVWTVNLPDAKAGKWPFRALYVNGRRATRARSPNAGFFHIVKAGPDNRTSFSYRKGDIPELKMPGDAEIVFLHDWATSRVPFKSIDSEKQTATLIDEIGVRHPRFGFTGFEPHPRYFVEGAAEFLDAPGEWHLDTRTGRLTYIPLEGETIETATVVAPRIERFLEVEGRAEHPVRNLHFVGFVFKHTNWPLSKFGTACAQAAFYEIRSAAGERKGREIIPAAVRFGFTVDSTIRRCRFLHLGGSGIALRKGSHRNLIEGCEVTDAAANGINVGEGDWARRVMKDGKAVWEEIPDAVVKKNVVSNCLVQQCGQLFYGSIGIWVGITDGTVVRHCEIRDLPYTGVSVGWRWDTMSTACANNIVENSHIHHVMQMLSDGGGIYTLGRQPGTVLRGNHIHDIPANAGRAESNGMFLDQGTSLLVIENNVLHSIAKSALRFHLAEKNTVRGNTIFLASKQKPYMFNNCSPDTMTFDDKHMPAKLVTTAEGRIGRALKCDGSASHLAVPHDPKLEPEQLTLEAWVKLRRYPTGKDTRRWIAGKNANEWAEGHYAIGISGRTVFAALNIGDGSENSRTASVGGEPLTLNKWHHLAMTYNGKHLRAYLDGVGGKPVEVGKKRRPGRGPFDIGARPDGFVFFEGAVDEVRLYRRILTEDEIARHAKQPERITADNDLVRHWDFEMKTDQPGDLNVAEQAGLQSPFREYLLGDEEGK